MVLSPSLLVSAVNGIMCPTSPPPQPTWVFWLEIWTFTIGNGFFTYDMFPDIVEPLQENPLYKIILACAIENSGWPSKDPFDWARMEIYVSILFYLQVYYLYYLFSSERLVLLGERISSCVMTQTLPHHSELYAVRSQHPSPSWASLLFDNLATPQYPFVSIYTLVSL